MSNSSLETDGKIWFFTRSCAAKKEESRCRAQLFYGNSTNTEYLSISGDGEVIADPDLLERFEQKLLDEEHPFLTAADRMLICVNPTKAYSWDMRRGKMVSLLDEETVDAKSFIA